MTNYGDRFAAALTKQPQEWKLGAHKIQVNFRTLHGISEKEEALAAWGRQLVLELRHMGQFAAFECRKGIIPE